MKTSILAVAFVMLALAFAVTHVYAGIVIKIEIDDLRPPAPTKYTTTLYIQDNNLKMDTTTLSVGEGKTELIYLADQRVLQYVMHSDGTYVELDEAALLELSKEIRENIVGLKEKVGLASEDSLGKDFEIKKQVGRRRISELDCDKFLVFKDGERIQEVWVAAWKDVGIEREDFSVLRKVSSSYDEIMSTLSAIPLLRDIEYVPMGGIMGVGGYSVSFKYYRDNAVLFEVSLRPPQKKSLSKSLFMIPKGYSRR